MEEAIKKIIEIEHEAQNLVAQGYAYMETIKADTLEELKGMEETIIEMSNQKIKKLKETNRREAEEKLQKIKDDTQNKIRILEEYVEENRDAWENQILAQIIRR